LPSGSTIIPFRRWKVSWQSDAAKAEERLSEIGDEAARLRETMQASYDEMEALGDSMVEAARCTRTQAEQLANLRAEARYLCLAHGLDLGEDLPESEDRLEMIHEVCRDVAAKLKPVGPAQEWITKLQEVKVSKGEKSFLSPKERAELRSRLEETVCPLCVNYALDGSCTLQAFDRCPITTYQDRVVDMIQKMGHRPWMEDYFESMYQDICPLCRDRSTQDVCVPREEGDCALFTYLPAIVKTVEDFLKERSSSQSSEKAQED
jgi:hypothetical protein